MPNETAGNELRAIRDAFRKLKANELPHSAARTISDILAAAHELRAKMTGLTEFDGPYKIQENKEGVRIFGPGVDMTVLYGFVKPNKLNQHLSERTITFLYARERCIDLNVAYTKGAKGLKQ